ncbi:MAG: hypothetical protein JSS64_05465 [Bacteroidetes bacterium]|nr:hypothetical protein [Bacteroidota bacterium]
MTFNQTINTKAAITTVIVHALLLLLFLFVRYNVPPTETVQDLGMEVNLGTSDNGSGADQPLATDAPAALAVQTEQISTSSNALNEPHEILTSDDKEAPVITKNIPVENRKPTPESKPKEKQTSTQTVAATTATPSKPKPQPARYVYNGATGTGGNQAVTNRAGSSEGNTNGNGDRGVPAGVPGSSNYSGSPGNGTGGISHNLSGRDISPKQFVAEFNEGGKVVVRVRVNREGNILSKEVIRSSSSTLSKIAMQKLSEARFSKNSDAAPEQIGDVTFIFKTRAQ